MKLAMNFSFLQGKLPTQEAAQLVSEAGFDSVDYSLMDMVRPDCVYNGKDYMAVAEETGKLLRSCNVPVTQTHTPFQFADFDDPGVYPAIVRSIEASAALGAKVAVVHPLHHMVYAGHEEEIFHLNMDFYRSLIPVCKSCGIKVGVENMFQRDPRRGHIVHDTCSRAEEFCRYIDTLDSEYMVACLDVGHVGLPTQMDEPWDVIRKLGHERLQSLHIHDNDYKDDRHGAPFTGTINWYEVTKALGEIDYTGDFTYEVNFSKIVGSADKAVYPAALRYLADIGKHLVGQVERNRKYV